MPLSTTAAAVTTVPAAVDPIFITVAILWVVAAVALVVLIVRGIRRSRDSDEVRNPPQEEKSPKAPPTGPPVALHSQPIRFQTWPSHLDYVGAIAHASSTLVTCGLSDVVPRSRDFMGNPALISGQNAAVFLVDSQFGPTALRCLVHDQPGSRERYMALSALPWHPACIITTRWIDDAILIKNRLWPIIQMELVEGDELHVAIERHLGDSASLRALGQRIYEAVQSLQGLPFGHGDLQHGNILVEPGGAVRLVDYDGIWLPGIGQRPNEIGHPAYRHPDRAARHWGINMDAFSGVLIWLSVHAVAADPSLWQRFHVEGENLIFMPEDLATPHRTDVWKALYRSPDDEVVRVADCLAQLCYATEPPTEPIATYLGFPWWDSGRPRWPDLLPALPAGRQ